ncbi:MAG: BatA domain-containing protein, partial [Kiloniellales bacterium]|nr:BatA domain-containing protein [Kiloniellales bacterium]
MNILDLGLIAFANPFLLMALALLPLLWLLLRVTPPAPRRQLFPAIRLLSGLEAREETPVKTPWWLILLRTIAAGLVILGLAQPILNPDQRFSGSGPLVLIIDDGWASARFWSRRQATGDRLAAQADREGRDVIIATTAPRGVPGEELSLVRLPADEARKIISTLKPKPWPVRRSALLDRLEAILDGSSTQIVWLSDGLAGEEKPDDLQAFVAGLRKFGRLDIIEDPLEATARLLLPPESDGLALNLLAERAYKGGEDRLNVLSIGPEGEVIAKTELIFAEGERRGSGILDLPAELRNRIALLRIEEEKGANSTILLDERWRRRPVGIVEEFAEAANQPLLSGAFFLERALAPYTELRQASLETLLARELAVVILTDDSNLDGYEKLEEWVNQGGLLLRFAGPRLAQDPSGPLPIDLRGRDRVLGGALTWNKPERLADFPEDSPFEGLVVPDDVLINR